MPHKLVAQALPRRAVYHKIEFGPGAKAPTPPFFVELRKEYREVHPNKWENEPCRWGFMETKGF
jgi:hypothetical protein